MKSKITLAVRLLLGLLFFAGGIAGLLKLAPPPDDLPESLKTFNAGLMASGYFMPFLKGTETLIGLALLINRFIPLALIVLAPISINIFLVHLFMMPSGLVLALLVGAALIYLAFFSEPYSSVIKKIFVLKAD